jgi:hypothetical protein
VSEPSARRNGWHRHRKRSRDLNLLLASDFITNIGNGAHSLATGLLL